MPMQTVQDLFEHELQDMLAGERTLLEALAQMARESADREVKKAYTQHRKATQGQIRRIERVFRMIGRRPHASSCPGIDGLQKEKKTFMRERPSDELVEYFNIAAAQKVERYEISSYENLIDMADKLGLTDAVELLEENLQEEEAALNTLKVFASEFDVTDEIEAEVQSRE
jgi:ferritin-like metal-binding protein YciE